jgi:hypothetical protein
VTSISDFDSQQVHSFAFGAVYVIVSAFATVKVRTEPQVNDCELSIPVNKKV